MLKLFYIIIVVKKRIKIIEKDRDTIKYKSFHENNLVHHGHFYSKKRLFYEIHLNPLKSLGFLVLNQLLRTDYRSEKGYFPLRPPSFHTNLRKTSMKGKE